ncbi:hypothetical protein JOQ06_026193 [Pogonophryne albipinna]|uniref:Uncharacterized protein n=1 Tax=Pogonophryne albipinna TaxID=1090488 RepID=A0AAD6F6T7_9TELE|nr:hypothetical protein JOQ06_026193 [Pogonophryne albipinna]
MQGKLVDLEGRSRRNNMRIYGVPEEKEDSSRQDAHSLGLGNTHILYDSAQDAAQELRRRGFSVEIPDRNASELYPEMERLHQTKTWQRVGESSAGGTETTSRVRKRLQEYERIPPETN